MNTIPILEYFKKLNLPIMPIPISIVYNKEKKKKEKKLDVFKETNTRPSYEDFASGKYLAYKDFEGYEYGAVDTSSVNQIDIDTESSKSYSPEVEKFIETAKIDRPFFRSIGKGNPHFLFKNETPLEGGKRIQTTLEDIELLTGQWSWFKMDSFVYNASTPLKALDMKYIHSKAVKKKKILKSSNSETIILPKKEPIKPSIEQTEILDNISEEYWSNYDDWIKLVWAMYSEFNSVELCDTYSKRASNYEDISAIEKLCHSDTKKAMTFGTLAYYSKKSNENKYIEIKAKYSPIKFSDKEYDIANLYINTVGDNIVKQDDEVYIYSAPFWKKDKKLEALRINITRVMCKVFTTQLINLLKEEQENPDKDNSFNKKLVNTSISLIKTGARQKAIAEQVKFILQNEEYNFDLVRPEVFCFKNISFDLIKRQQCEINKYDYISLNSKYDYRKSTPEEYETISNFIEEILPHKEVREAALSVLRLALQGNLDQYFVLFNGDGGNGKGCILELFEKVLGGDYYYDGQNSTLTKTLKSGADPAVANSNKKRCIVYSEPDESEKLNTSTIKQLTGCAVINGRTLYSENTKVYLTSTSILQCNQRPKLSGRTDNALMRRIVDIEFPMTFVNSKEDLIEGNDMVKLKNEKFAKADFKDIHKYALFEILLNNKHDKIYIPDEVVCRTKKFLFNNDDLLNWFFKYYKATDNKKDYLTGKSLYEEFRASEVYNDFTKDERRNEWSESKFIEKLKTNVALRRHWYDRKKINKKEIYSCLTNYIKIADSYEFDEEIEE